MSCCECTTRPPCLVLVDSRVRVGEATLRCYFANAGQFYRSVTRGLLPGGGNIGRIEQYGAEAAWSLPCVATYGGTGWRQQTRSGALTLSDGTYTLLEREDYTYDSVTGEQSITYSGTGTWARGGPTECGGFFDPETGEWVPPYDGSYSIEGVSTRAPNGTWTRTQTTTICGETDTDAASGQYPFFGDDPWTVEASHPADVYGDAVPTGEALSRARAAMGPWTDWVRFQPPGGASISNDRDARSASLDEAQLRIIHPPSPSGYLKVWLVREEEIEGETVYSDFDTYEWQGGGLNNPALPFWDAANLIIGDPIDVPSPDPDLDDSVSIAIRVEKWSCVEGWEPQDGEESGYPVAPGDEPVIVPGCTDPTAANFNPAANEDDGSCTY